MDIQQSWQKALRETEIIRARVKNLASDQDTHVPYVLLSASSRDKNDTLIRKGKITVKKPAILLPPQSPQFKGFEFEGGDGFNEALLNSFLIIRGVHLPSLKYQNDRYSLDIYEDDLKKAVNVHLDQLQRKEDVHTGLIVGPEDCWQFSLIIYIFTQVSRNAQQDVQKYLDDLRNK